MEHLTSVIPEFNIPQDYSRDRSYGYPLCSIYQITRFSERKQIFTICHIVCTSNLGLVNHSYMLGMLGILPKFKFPDSIQGLTLQAGLFKYNSLKTSILTLFYIIHPIGPQLGCLYRKIISSLVLTCSANPSYALYSSLIQVRQIPLIRNIYLRKTDYLLLKFLLTCYIWPIESILA